MALCISLATAKREILVTWTWAAVSEAELVESGIYRGNLTGNNSWLLTGLHEGKRWDIWGVWKQKSLRRLCLGRALGAEIGETFLGEVEFIEIRTSLLSPPQERYKYCERQANME